MIRVFLTLAFVAVVDLVSGQKDFCDFYQMMAPNSSYEVYSKGYKRGLSAERNVQCRYAFEAPPGYKVSATCRFAFLSPIPKCINTLRISRRGRFDLKDAATYCGWLGRVSTTSLNNRLTIEFKTGSFPYGSKFRCALQAIPNECECGRRNGGGGRIVGGNETLINEFPLMASIVLGNTGVQCGATIISNRAVLSAAHCFGGYSTWEAFRVVVGEHDVSRSDDSKFTRSYNISSVITPQEYPKDKNFDIALVFTAETIVFDFGVAASCLPFKFLDNSFSNEKALGLGWGTIEFAGPKSDVLKKVELLILDEFICSGNEICAQAGQRDTCQYDSGGPLLYQDPGNNLLYNIGVIRSGDFCGVAGQSENTRVTGHINWILNQTYSTTYCVK